MDPTPAHPPWQKPPHGAARSRIMGIAWLCLMALLGGCQGGDDSDPDVMTPDSGAPDAGAPTYSLTLSLSILDIPATGPRGTLTLQADDLQTGVRRMFDLGPTPAQWPARLDVDGLPAGGYEITVFFDRDDDDQHDGCPWPPAPSHPSIADQLDNLYARGTAQIGGEGAALDLILERHICGPGEEATGLTGTLTPPEGVSLEAPVGLYLVPLPSEEAAPVGGTAEDGIPTSDSSALYIPLFPRGLASGQRFSIGQLLPGRYRLTAFEDTDLDGQPTPCGDGVGGGDRHVTTLDEIVISPGQRLSLGPALTLSAADGCPDQLTGLAGSVALNAMLQQALEEEQMARSAELDLYTALRSSEVRLALLNAAGAPVLDVDLFDRLGDQPLPRPFTVTGLPEGVWRLVIYLDADRDGLFSPCGGLSSGLDRIYVQLDRAQIIEGEITELDEIALAMPDDCPTTARGITGQLIFDREEGAVGSGRPIRLELIPQGGAGERRNLLIFENHQTVLQTAQPVEDTGGYRFTVAGDLPAGQYQARFYIDTNWDGVYSSCLVNRFGDRASAAYPEIVEITEGEISDLGVIHVAREVGPQGEICQVPRFEIQPSLRWDLERFEPFEATALRVYIQELGGWQADLQLAPDLSALTFPWSPSGLREPQAAEPGLAPGIYTLTFYVDQGDGAFTACGLDYADGIYAQTEIRLEPATEAPVRLQLSLEDVCY